MRYVSYVLIRMSSKTHEQCSNLHLHASHTCKHLHACTCLHVHYSRVYYTCLWKHHSQRMCIEETWGAGVDIHPSFTFSVSNPFFGSICTKWITITTRSWNGTQWHVIREPCTSKAVTDAYVQRSSDFLFWSVCDRGTRIFLFSWVSTLAPLVSSSDILKITDTHVDAQHT